jgi:hypothetical protein
MQPPLTRQSHITKVAWAIELAQKDLEQLTDGDWLNLKNELFDFLTAEIEWSFGVNAKRLRNEDIVALGQLITEARTDLNDVDRYDIDKMIVEEEDQLKAIALADQDRNGWNHLVTVENMRGIREHLREMLDWVQTEDYSSFIDFEFPPPQDDWLPCTVGARFRLYLIAAGVDKSQIRSCPECKRVFLAKIKPQSEKVYYCTHRCAQIVASRAYRERNKNKLKPRERERKRRRYVEEQRRKHGPNVKVERKPRQRKV